MSDRDALAAVARVWAQISEETRKQVFQAVHRANKSFFGRLSDEMHGFTPRGLAARPPAVATRLDRILFSLDAGAFADAFMSCYFTRCNSAIDDRFEKEYRVLARASPDTPRREITERTLEILRHELGDSEVFRLFEKALHFCAPHFLTEEPPDPSELDPGNEVKAQQAATDEVTEELPPRGETGQSRRADGPTPVQRSLESLPPPAPRREQPELGKMASPQAARDVPRLLAPADYVAAANMGEIIECVTRKLKTMPAAEAEQVLRTHQNAISSCTRDYGEYTLRKKEFSKLLAELRRRGLVSSDADDATFSNRPSLLPMPQAIDALLKWISQATALLEKHARVGELAEEVGVGPRPQAPYLEMADLGQLIQRVDAEIADLEMALQEKARSESLLVDLVDRLQSCDCAAATKLVTEATGEFWRNVIHASLVCLEMQKSNPDRRGAPVLNAAEVATSILHDALLPSLIVNVAWQVNPTCSADILEMLAKASENTALATTSAALAGLTVDQQQAVTSERPHIAVTIGWLTLISAVANRNLDTVRWLQALSRCDGIPSKDAAFFRECAIAHDRGHLVEDLSSLLGNALPSSPAGASQDAAKRELQKYAEVHGLAGNYRKLRELAREHYVTPTMRYVTDGQPAAALKHWADYGDYDDMAQHVANDCDSMHRPEQRHINKTRQYLVTFGEALARWAAMAPREKSGPAAALTQSFRDLNKGAGDSTTRFVQMLRSVTEGKRPPGTPPEHFGKIASAPGNVSRAYIDPTQCESWILACNSATDEAPAAHVLAERMLHLLCRTSRFNTPQAILHELLRRSEFVSAAMLAGVFSELEPVLSQQLEERKRAVLTGFEAIWDTAQKIAQEDGEINLWTVEIERLMQEFSFEDAKALLPDLQESIRHYQEVRQSDEYKNAAQVLRDAGREVRSSATLSELRQEIQSVRTGALETRRHIVCLEQVLSCSDYDAAFKRNVTELLGRIDRPKQWPSPDRSKDIAEALQIILDFLRSKARWRENRPDRYHQLSSALALFLAKNLEDMASTAGLSDLALSIEAEVWEADEVLAFVRERVSMPELQEPAPEGAKPGAVVRDIAEVSVAPTAISKLREPRPHHELSAKELLAKIRGRIRELAKRSARNEIPQDKHRALRALCRERKWAQARELSACLVLNEATDDDWLTLFETTYCIAFTLDDCREHPPIIGGDDISAICLAMTAPIVTGDPAGAFYYADRDQTTEALLRGFLRGVDPARDFSAPTVDLRACLAADLSTLANIPSGEPCYRWANEVFHEGRVLRRAGKQQNGSSVLAMVLWERLTGMSDPAAARADLLLLGFRLNLLDDFVTDLAKVYASPYDYHVLQFMQAVRSTEANDLAWDEARRLAQSFIEQVPANKMKPWRIMVETLNRTRKSEASQETCTITLENCTRTADDTFLLELCVTPGRYAIFESLRIEIGDTTNSGLMPTQGYDLIETGDLMPRQRIARVTVHVTPSAMADDAVVFPYRLVGRTTTGTQTEQRDRWSVQLRETSQKPLPFPTMSEFWKGAEGNPVDSSSKAYHGREKEHARLQHLLSGADGRQKSAVVIGQRRIGKTSLLVETLRYYPPKEGHVCAVFSQLGGIQKRAPDEPLSATVFHKLTEELVDLTGYHAGFCRLLTEALGDSWLRTLRKGLDPGTSIAAAFTTFVDRVAQATNGRIQRMAFFVDEFQNVFKYPPAEVDQVMWGLRPLVQMSPKISLVFAGSGLTRDLIRGYDKAFFGSIDTIQLRPFLLPEDYEAVAATFLPAGARPWLCPNPDRLEAVVKQAHYLTGGHPWYLSMLGRSAAGLLQGRSLTPPLLNEIADDMVAGRADLGDRETGAARFYGHLFDSLDATGKLKTHAQLVLTNIARQVTLEWPWLTATQAISGPKIEQARVSSRECLDALLKLKDEEVLEHKIENGMPRYRIRVPLVAEAVRFDADDIEYQVLEMLP